jgi:hypothetical protein
VARKVWGLRVSSLFTTIHWTGVNSVERGSFYSEMWRDLGFRLIEIGVIRMVIYFEHGKCAGMVMADIKKIMNYYRKE